MNGFDRIIRHIKGESIDRLPFMPITMMFAADQIAASYKKYVTDYRVLVEGQIATAEKFDIDYVSCISDPTREAFDYGAAVHFYENQPPAIDELNALLGDKTKLAKLRVPSPEEGTRMSDRLQAAALFRQKVGGEKVIEGWVEGPCAEAADLRGINSLMMDFYDDPGFVRDLFEFVVEKAIQFAIAQIRAGVDLIGIGDAAASLVGPTIYHDLVFPFERKLIEGIRNSGGRVRLHICGDTRKYLQDIGILDCEIVDLDFMVPLQDARSKMGPDQILLGNLNPVRVLLEGSESDVLKELEHCQNAAGSRYIVGAGCEIPRGTPEKNLHAMRRFCDSVEINY